eukprot:TRINITY_DN28044_c0_g1_i1.p2 TRINITY_DN28044_c0_g1~~TRINITY_DN28044_c0_g1_i1.p2  ORF type:complete len:113 (+),score=2.45 TRINITY_DN28044_c0_g1_i1:55-393(+)
MVRVWGGFLAIMIGVAPSGHSQWSPLQWSQSPCLPTPSSATRPTGYVSPLLQRACVSVPANLLHHKNDQSCSITSVLWIAASQATIVSLCLPLRDHGDVDLAHGPKGKVNQQ